MRSVQRAAWLLLLVVATGGTSACDPRTLPQADSGTKSVAPAMKDASVGAMSTGGASGGRSVAPDGGPFELPENVCSLHVGATCDGAEDCPRGQVCCGAFDPTYFTYRSIRCKESCDGQSGFEFCHPGDACRGGLVCRHSLIVPFDFMAVCASPMPSAPISGKRVAGEVACGSTSCDAHTEQCCLRARVSGASPPVGLKAYCTLRGESCDCEQEPLPAADASVDASDDPDVDGGQPSRRH